jgi:hypothetical protein
MNRISFSEELIQTLINFKGINQVRQEIDLKIAKIPWVVEPGAMLLGVDQIVLPFRAGGHPGKIVLEKFEVAHSIIEFRFRIADFLILKIGIEYLGMRLLTLLNWLGFSRVRRKGAKIEIDLGEILAGNLPAGLEIQLTSFKIDHGVELTFK